MRTEFGSVVYVSGKRDIPDSEVSELHAVVSAAVRQWKKSCGRSDIGCRISTKYVLEGSELRAVKAMTVEAS